MAVLVLSLWSHRELEYQDVRELDWLLLLFIDVSQELCVFVWMCMFALFIAFMYNYLCNIGEKLVFNVIDISFIIINIINPCQY